jgi:hypothetical protein
MIYGFDVSTSIIGCVAFSDKAEFVFATHLDLRKIDTGLVDKGDVAYEWLTNLSHDCNEDTKIFIEDRLQNFSAGKTMLQTLMKLAAFNAMISWMAKRTFTEKGFKCSVDHLHPSKVKSILRSEGLIIPKGEDKKKLTLDWVSKKEKNFVIQLNRNDNPQPWSYDEADAYATAFAGISFYELNAK